MTPWLIRGRHRRDEKIPCPEPRTAPCTPKARPFDIHKHRSGAIHWEKETRKDLNRDTDMDITQPKEVGKPTIWCAPMYVMAMRSEKPRRVVDFQTLYQAWLRQTHPTKASLLPLLDVWNGHHLGLPREEDQHITTFLTPWGSYKYCNLPKNTWQPATPTQPDTTKSPKVLNRWEGGWTTESCGRITKNPRKIRRRRQTRPPAPTPTPTGETS